MATPKCEVWIVRLGAGTGPGQIKAAQSANAAGIVLELFGSGNMPPDVRDSAIDAARHGCLIAFTTRTGDGMVRMHDEAGDFIPIGHLDALKARLVLMLGDANFMDRQELRDRLSAFNGP